MLGRLPEAWRKQVLATCGGTGDEDVDALAWAVAPRPGRPEALRTLDSIISRAGRLTPAVAQYMDVLADAVADHRAVLAVWDAARPMAMVAEAAATRAARLRHVDPGALRLLDADEDGLTTEAQRLVDAALARHRLVAARAAGTGDRADADAEDTTARDAVHPRERDIASQRRRLRRQVGRADAHAAGVLGLVGGRPEIGMPAYATNWSLDRWRAVQGRTAAYLATREAVAPDGRTIPLAEIAERARASAAASWYAMVLGMGEHARRHAHVPLMITATLPPQWHLHPRHGDRTRSDPALSPTAAAREMSRRLHAALCLARARGTSPYGVRVIEPHTDGCPHAHLLLWLPPEQAEALEAAFRRHFPPDGGAAEAALQVRRIDDGGPARPETYVMHYVMQILTPAADPETQRAQAWASHAGIRRLSLVGIRRGTIGLWRAAHRSLRDDVAPAEPRARAVRHAMRRGQWATALALLGAWADEARFAPVRETRVDCWGDEVRETVAWTSAKTGRLAFVRRPVRWTIKKVNHMAGNNISVIASDPRGAVKVGAGPPGLPGGTPPLTLDVGGPLRFPPTPPLH